MGCPGGCAGSNNNSGNRGYTPGNIQALSHGTCEGVTIDLLNMFKRLITCVDTHNIHAQVGITVGEAGNAKALLDAWITAKEQNPASCDHQEKLPLVQFIINKIVAYGQC